MKNSFAHLEKVTKDLVAEGRDRKRRLRERIKGLNSNVGAIRGPKDRPFHLWIFYKHAKANHETASQRATSLISLCKNLQS